MKNIGILAQNKFIPRRQVVKAIAAFLTGTSLIVMMRVGLAQNVKPSNSIALPCERYIVFVDPTDSFVSKLTLEERAQMERWTDSDRNAVCSAISQLYTKTPGLIERACNGKKLPIALANDTGDSSHFSMRYNPLFIQCSTIQMKRFRAHHYRTLRETLTHELVHAVDTEHALSDSNQWLQLVAPYLRKFREQNEPSRVACIGHINAQAAQWQLPSGYAATNNAEALAEYTSAMLTTDWKPPEAIQTFIQEKILSRPLNVDAARALLRQAYEEQHQRNFQKSITLYRQALRIDDSRFPLAHYRLGENYSALGQRQKSIEEYSQAICYLGKNIDVYSESKMPYTSRGHVYGKLGQHQKAISDYSKAIEINPRSVWVYSNRGCEYVDLRQYQKAIDDFDKALELNPKRAEDFNNRGFAYAKRGQHQRALDDYSKAIEISPKYSRTYINRAETYIKLGQYKNALDNLSIGINQLSDKTDISRILARLYERRAFVYIKLGEHGLAKGDRAKATELRCKADPKVR